MKSTYAVLDTRARAIILRERTLEPWEDQVLVQIIACGICRGDLLDFVQERPAPQAFGHEPVGRVLACGPWVKHLTPGDLVVGSVDGAFATCALGREAGLYRVPEELNEVGALAEPLKCVTTVLRAAAPDFRDAVAVVGCGFMGLAVIAALAGGWSRQLIGIDTDPARRQLAMEFGATMVIDPTAGDAVEQIRRVTDDRGADVAIDFAGNTRATTLAARLLCTRGRLIAAAGYLPEDRGMEIYLRAITTHFTPPAFSPDPADDFHRAIEAMASGRFPCRRLLSHRFHLSEIQQAFETALEGSAAGYIKGIVVNDVASMNQT